MLKEIQDIVNNDLHLLELYAVACTRAYESGRRWAEMGRALVADRYKTPALQAEYAAGYAYGQRQRIAA